MHVRHRVLNAALGCWLQRDPIGYADGLSLHEYVSSLAVTMIDPNCQFGFIITIIGGVVFWIAAEVLLALTPCIIGALSSAGFDLGYQIVSDCVWKHGFKVWKCDCPRINWCDVAVSAAFGCLAAYIIPTPIPWSITILKQIARKLGLKWLLNKLTHLGC